MRPAVVLPVGAAEDDAGSRIGGMITSADTMLIARPDAMTTRRCPSSNFETRTGCSSI